MVRTLLPLGLVVPLALVLAGCSAGDPGPAASSSGEPSPAASSAAPGGDAVGATEQMGGGVSGEIAYVSGRLMQVQDGERQTAVGWSDATSITSVVDGTLADVVPGVCVVAIGAATAVDEDSSGAAAPDADDPAVAAGGAATRVTVTQPVDGGCGAGGLGVPGGMPGSGFAEGAAGGMPTDLPSGMPTDLPSGMTGRLEGSPADGASGAPGGMRLVGAITAGRVTAVSGSQITVETAAADGAAGTATVTVDDSTAYTTTVAADETAIVVGQCVTARGEADTSGSVAATALTLTTPVDGTCTGFARIGVGPGRGGTTGTAPGGTSGGTTTGGSGA